MRKTVKYALLVIAAFTLFTMPITVPHFKSSSPYSVFNDGWDGLSRFAGLLYSGGKTPVPILGPLDEYSLSGGTLMIIEPDVDYSPEEIESIRKFVERGNTLFIADDFGTANEILEGLNTSMRLSRSPLRDFFYEVDDRFVIAVRIADPVLGRNVSRIVTDDPSAVIVTGKGEVYTSGTAMINFRRKPYPILAIQKYGRGRIIVLADPDVLSNNLFDENREFLKNLVDYIPGPVYVDEAHHGDFNLYTQGTVTIKRFLPKEKAEWLIIITGLLVVLHEFGVSNYLLAPFRNLLLRFIGEEESVEELALRLARERGWDEEEVIEMLNAMGDGR